PARLAAPVPAPQAVPGPRRPTAPVAAPAALVGRRRSLDWSRALHRIPAGRESPLQAHRRGGPTCSRRVGPAAQLRARCARRWLPAALLTIDDLAGLVADGLAGRQVMDVVEDRADLDLHFASRAQALHQSRLVGEDADDAVAFPANDLHPHPLGLLVGAE